MKNISARFEYRKPNEVQLLTLGGLRESFSKMEFTLNSLPPSRELSLALTKLEEAAMWANKAVTHA